MNESCERSNKTRLNEKTNIVDSFDLCRITNSQWETDRWPVFVQVHRSNDVASNYKWQMFVKYASRGNAGLGL